MCFSIERNRPGGGGARGFPLNTKFRIINIGTFENILITRRTGEDFHGPFTSLAFITRFL